MAIKTITHYNFLGANINDLAKYGAVSSDYTVYCKRAHAIKSPTLDDCNNCPYSGGFMNGEGYECIWEDVNPVEVNELYVYPNDKQKEYMRVSKLIDEGLIERG